MCLLPISILEAWVILVLNLSFMTLTSLTVMKPLPLHDALPISGVEPLSRRAVPPGLDVARDEHATGTLAGDRKGTRLNSSDEGISYAVFCLEKKDAGIKPAILGSNVPTPDEAVRSHVDAAMAKA